MAGGALAGIVGVTLAISAGCGAFEDEALLRAQRQDGAGMAQAHVRELGIEIVLPEEIDGADGEILEPGHLYARSASGALAQLVVRGGPERREDMAAWQVPLAEEVLALFLVERELSYRWLLEETAQGRILLHTDQAVAAAEAAARQEAAPDEQWVVQSLDEGHAVYPRSALRARPEIAALYERRDVLRVDMGVDVIACFVFDAPPEGDG